MTEQLLCVPATLTSLQWQTVSCNCEAHRSFLPYAAPLIIGQGQEEKPRHLVSWVGLNESGPQRLKRLDGRSPVGLGAVRGLEEVCHWGQL